MLGERELKFCTYGTVLVLCPTPEEQSQNHLALDEALVISSQPLFAPNPPSHILCDSAPAAPSLQPACHASLFLRARILVALPGAAEMPPLPQFLPGPRGENNSFSEMLVALSCSTYTGHSTLN